MQVKNHHFKKFLIILLFVLTGCFGEKVESSDAPVEDANSAQEVMAEEPAIDAYDEAIENGLKEVDNENYEEAVNYFEIALEENPEDETAVVFIDQIEHYIEARDLFNQEKYEESRVKLEVVQSFQNGLDGLNEKADNLIIEIEAIETAIREEQEAIEAAKKAEEEAEAARIAEQEAIKAAEIEAAQNAYSYSDFVGYYLHFNSADHSHSDMIATIGYDFLTVGWWMSEFELYDVIDYSINENVLTIDYYLRPFYEEESGDYGTLTVYLLEENGQKYIDFGSDMPFYKATYEEVGDYGYSIKDYLYEDIHR